ncbi:MAG: cupin, partial [Pseudomonadota bacterium]
IGAEGKLYDRPGFDVDFISRSSLTGAYSTEHSEVLMPMRGHWKLTWDGGSATLNPGDTVLVPPGLTRELVPSMTGEASLYRVRGTQDPAGPTVYKA